MNIKFADEIVKEMEERGPIQMPENSINGEEYEKWLYEEEKIMKVLIEIDKEEYERICAETSHTFLSGIIAEGVALSDNATNGDIFELLLDNRIDTEIKFEENFNGGIRKKLIFDKTWWNAPYKRENEE